MDWSQTEFEGHRCPLWMKESLDKMVRLSVEMGCMKSPRQFFTKLYGKYKFEKTRYRATEGVDPEARPFLEAECSVMDKMYRKICSRFETEVQPPVLTNMGSLTNIEDIEANNILFIRCPTIFAGYHFMFAVVNETGNFVDIYQAYGTKPLYKIRGIPLEIFQSYLKFLKNIKTISQEEALYLMIYIEENLYNTNIKQKTDDYFEQIARNIEEGLIEENEDSDEDITDPKTPEEYIKLNFMNNVINNDVNLTVEVLKFNYSDCQQTAGRTKRKYKKRKARRTNKKY
jgi:hypothetical protein